MKICTLTFIIFISVLNTNAQWERISSPAPSEISHICVVGNNVFVNSPWGIFLSSDSCDTWQPLTNNLYSLTSLSTNGSMLVATQGTTFYYSVDTGASWITKAAPDYSGANCPILISSDIFAAYGEKIYSTSDTGQTWIRADSGISAFNIMALGAIGSKLIAGTDAGIFISSNNGHSWIKSDSGIVVPTVLSLLVNGSDIYVGINGGGVYLSTDSGAFWTQVNNGLPWNYVSCFAAVGNNVFAGTVSHGMAMTNNQGGNWTPVNTGFIYNNVKALAVLDSVVLSSIQYAGIYSTNNLGGNWIPKNRTLLTSAGYYRAIASIGTTIFLGHENAGLFVSYDDGNTWETSYNGLASLSVFSLLVINNEIFAGTGDGVYLSSDSGHTWIPKNTGIFGNIFCLANSGTNIFAASSSGMYLSTDHGNTWSPINNGLPNGATVVTMTATNSDVYIGTTMNGIYRSANNGSNWTQINNGIQGGGALSINYIRASGSNIYAVRYGNDFYESTNNGNNWSLVSSTISQFSIESLEVNAGIFFSGAGSSVKSVFISDDFCHTWMPFDTSSSYNGTTAIGFDSDHVFKATDNYIYRRALSEIVSVNYLQSQENIIRIYPNPVISESHFDFQPESANPLVIIKDITGKEVSRFKFYDKPIRKVDFDPGIYIILIKDGEKQFYGKIVVD